MSNVVRATLIAIAISVFVGSYTFSQQLPAQQPTSVPTGEVPVTAVPGRAAAEPAPGQPSQPAVPVKEVPSPATPSHYQDQVIWALMASYVMEYLKKTNWFSFLNETSSARLQAQFGFVAALLTAAGIHFAVSGSVLDGGGAAITISGISFDAFKDIAFQWASQQGWYDLVVRKSSSVPVVKP